MTNIENQLDLNQKPLDTVLFRVWFASVCTNANGDIKTPFESKKHYFFQKDNRLQWADLDFCRVFEFGYKNGVLCYRFGLMVRPISNVTYEKSFDFDPKQTTVKGFFKTLKRYCLDDRWLFVHGQRFNRV